MGVRNTCSEKKLFCGFNPLKDCSRKKQIYLIFLVMIAKVCLEHVEWNELSENRVIKCLDIFPNIYKLDHKLIFQRPLIIEVMQVSFLNF